MKRLFVIVICVLLASMQVFGQKDKADKHFGHYQYDKAIPLYEKYLADSATDYMALRKLAWCYRQTRNADKELALYKTIVSLKESNADDLFRLIQILRAQQNIPEATTYALRYKSLAPGEKADNLMKALEMYHDLKAGSTEYVLTNKTAQYAISVYGVTKYKTQIITTAEDGNGNKSKGAGGNYTDLFATDTSFEKLTPFADGVMVKSDDGTPVFTDNGSTMYYTSTYEDFAKEGKTNIRRLKISIARLDGNKWKKGEDFQYDSKQYMVAHPAISADGALMVFASDMPGGKGGMDLYLCTRQGNSWSAPQNIASLNTSENELFPVFDNNGDLYFSSNGLPGLGGLDLFRAKRRGETFDAPVNLKSPFNSSYDDFSLFSDDDLKSGYLSSNRIDNRGKDRVFYFEQPQKAVEPAYGKGLTVKVLDKYTRTPLPYVTVTIKDKSGQLFHQGLTDPVGQLVLDELPRGEYTIQGMLNDVSTTIGKVTDDDFKANTAITKEVYHNDPRFTLAGIAINTRTSAALPGVLITCSNATTGTSKKATTGADGKFLFQLEQNSDFKVQGQKKGWLSSEVDDKTTRGLDRTQQLYVNLEMKIQQPVSNGTITLKKIHYDYNKCDIRADAALELDRVTSLLNDYPDMTVELSSHTDSRGDDGYNMKLSQCRADAALNYLVNQGVKKSRLTAKGYGETKLLNGCSNGVKCTEEQHGENRRTEFTILSCASCPH